MSNAIATRVATYNAIKTHRITAITSSQFTHDQVLKLRRELTGAAMIVSTPLGGGEHGHTFFLYDETGYRTFTGKAAVTIEDSACPDADPGIADNDASGVVARKTAQWKGKIDTHYAKEGVKAALRDLIVKNVPSVTIEALNDEDSGFANVTPFQLLDHLFSKAKLVDTIGIKKLLQERDQPIDFEGDMSLDTFFTVIEKLIRKLKKQKPPIDTSLSNLRANWLHSIEEYGAKPAGYVFQRALVKWYKLDQVNQEQEKFKEIFGEADDERRRALALMGNSANGLPTKDEINNVEVHDIVNTYMSKAMEVFVGAAQETINNAVDTKFKDLGNSATSDTSSNEKLKNEISQLRQQLAGAKNSTTSNDDKFKDHPRRRRICKACNQYHGGDLDDKCWTKKENRANATDAWRKANPE